MSPSIGILIDRLIVGGVEKTAIQEVDYLNRAGHHATLLVLRRQRTVPAAYLEILDNVPLVYLDDRLPSPLRFSFPLPFFAFFSLFHLTYPIFMPRVIAAGEFDVIVSHNSYTTFTAWSLNKLRGIPYVMFIWDPVRYIVEKAYPHGPIRWALAVVKPLATLVDSMLLAGASSAVVGSPRHERYLFQINRHRRTIFRAPPGAQFADQIPERRMDYLLSATAWKAGKQLEVLLDVVAEVSGARLIVAGDWLDAAYRTKIEGCITNLGLRERVSIVGSVSETRLAELYSGARLSLTLNAELGFGMPVLEAISHGSPIACPQSSGVAAYFDSNDAFYFDEGDREAIKLIVERLLNNERLAHAVGQRAWAKARRIHTWQAHAEVVLGSASAALHPQACS